MPEIINHSVSLLNPITPEICPIRLVESAARTCYQSDVKPDATQEDRRNFVRRLIRNGHTAMIEFASVGFRIITDRGVTHELVRHRIASWAQESTRYCNYGGKPIQFIIPVSLQAYQDDGSPLPDPTREYTAWYHAVCQAEEAYNEMIEAGCSPQIARSVLPNSLKTEICMHMNMRSFRNFVTLRTAKSAHPDMRHVASLCVDLVRGTEYFVFIEDLV